jgi:hypothetical protein
MKQSNRDRQYEDSAMILFFSMIAAFIVFAICVIFMN